ncbi:Tic22 family protein [Leptolyngbya sp. FACHB-261]|uniref:Tic22 family protein n=1 Tax=Leptolyngbya sp. FACHB-261 TaxID=2692806 RepID=UPI0016898222|nr:Tic22 family protein [Leptolyngbya sp. FACHB-261]MBD2100220.1 hypothetical protein [Leptolyngbya sp. FACHB-261]
MSRTFIRSGTVVGLVGGLILGLSGVGEAQAQNSQPAQAPRPAQNNQQRPAPNNSQQRPAQTPQQAGQPLSETQVLQRFEVVPVFTVTDNNGAPITASSPQVANGAQIATFFLSYQDAQTALTQIRSNNPTIGNQAKIQPISMSRALQIIRQQNQQNPPQQGQANAQRPGNAGQANAQRPARNQGNAQGNAQRPGNQAQAGQPDLVFQFWPREENVQSALTILRTDGQQVEQFPGVPLFYLVGGRQNNQGLLTLQQDGREVIPFFFDRQDAQALLERLRQQQPDLATAAEIEVTSLSRVIGSMLDRNAAAESSRISFVPSRQALESVRSLQGTPGQGQGQSGQRPAQPAQGAGQARPNQAQPARPNQAQPARPSGQQPAQQPTQPRPATP